ncbi:MAG: hypothetical protein ACLPID_18305 [Beijerinckiaceae bacterium]
MTMAPTKVTEAPIKLVIFTSSVKDDLHSFVAEGGEVGLPKQFAPWTKVGVVRANERPPHKLERDAIQRGIAEKGFQLWRKTKIRPDLKPLGLRAKAAKSKSA